MSINGRRLTRSSFRLSVPPSGGAFTGGAGGALTDQLSISFTSGGMTGQYHRYAAGRTNSTITRPMGLVLQFHGDGAYEFYNPNSSYSLGGSNGIRQVALDYNMICVPLLTPNSDKTWWTTGNANADWVNGLVTTELYPRYNIDRSRIWLSGYSGGAQFISQYLVPEYSAIFVDGGAVISGGGGAPGTNSDPSTINPFSVDFKRDFALHWFTATGDTGWDDDGYNAYADAQAGELWYRNRGFGSLSHNYPVGGGHSTVTTLFGAELRARMIAKYGG